MFNLSNHQRQKSHTLNAESLGSLKLEFCDCKVSTWNTAIKKVFYDAILAITFRLPCIETLLANNIFDHQDGAPSCVLYVHTRIISEAEILKLSGNYGNIVMTVK